MTKIYNLKYELKSSYNGGGDAYLLQSVAIHLNYIVLALDGD